MTAGEKQTLTALEHHSAFVPRHIGPGEAEVAAMLEALGASSLDELLQQTVPEAILQDQPPALGDSHTEEETLDYLRNMVSRNTRCKSFIGMGYHGTHTPAVIGRNVLENPGWYTAYTPYQPEVAQGRLEALINFQQMTLDLTGLDLASASLLDEGTAAGETMGLARRVSKNKKSNLFYVDENCHPQTIDVIKTRAAGFSIEVKVGPAEAVTSENVFGALLAYPGTYGQINDYSQLITELHECKAIVAVVADIMSLVKLKAPGDLGADVVLGNAQRFGVPMGFGGPHAAFFACRDQYKRSMPGRVIGVSVDSRGNRALRMAMQTREQHIRREKATSNICTAQVLLANMSSFYAVYHGPEGLRRIADRINRLTDILAAGLKQQGIELVNDTWFDTITIKVADRQQVLKQALEVHINLRPVGSDQVGISLDETTTRDDIISLWNSVLGKGHGLSVDAFDHEITQSGSTSIPENLQRTDAILTHPVFNSYHSETEMMRYLKRLEDKDIALNRSMIALGSCTMKLNAATEMAPVTWPEIAEQHPFVPREQAEGTIEMITELEEMLRKITGMDAVCMQPNSGAQGEYAGLMAIRGYLESKGEGHRDVCLIPSSAHGTNPASAMMAGMKIVVVGCDDNGNVKVDELKQKAEELSEQLACIMITYPSTHGVYEEGIREICDIIHTHGGQVYMDGANLNAQVCISQPGDIGADVTHMNLHKTFCIPHGGGGPGMGPIGIKQHLVPFLPNHSVVKLEGPDAENSAVNSAPWGSVSILPISWSYIRMMGAQGLRKATAVAILNANYLAKKLGEHFPVLYTGRNGRVAHECIIDLRPLKASSGISEEDVAKRLMDFGYHAPTMSFPVAGTLMIEPTESESKAEIDRFVETMATICREIDLVEQGKLDATNNMLTNAPHTLEDIMDTEWERPYSKNDAAFPAAFVKQNKFWPTVNRIDNVYGDRNLQCACPPIGAYEE